MSDQSMVNNLLLFSEERNGAIATALRLERFGATAPVFGQTFFVAATVNRLELAMDNHNYV